MSSKRHQWGVTAPISTASPSDHELHLTESLLKALGDFHLFECEAEALKRKQVLEELDRLVKDFVVRVGKAKGLPDALATDAGGKIFTFGSYRLGVHSAGADIDTLCVVPQHVEREQFFTIMQDMLKARSEVTDLTAVPEAYVPVIKMRFSGIPIDLVFAQLALPRVPDDVDLKDNNLLKNIGEQCVRSLNGSRVTDEILRLVPNIPVFRIALRTIKLWAKRRAIYSNVMGFLGGVAWAMLTARVCQLYPNACAASIVNRFFRIMYQWNWPQPILLKHLEDGPLEVRVWNPKLYPADKSHRMPIITPAYPSMCATHNVTDSTRDIMLKEFKRGAEVVEKIVVKSGNWSELFEESDFFQIYKHYLQIVVTSTTPEAKLLWSGYVESRIRQLVLKLELVDMLLLAHPYINGVDRMHYCISDKERLEAAQGIYASDRTFRLGEGDPVKELKKQPSWPKEKDTRSVQPIYTTTFYIGLCVGPKTDTYPPTNGPRTLDLVWPTQEFIKLVRSWDKFDSHTMNVCVKTLKSSMLPTELAGEDKMKRPPTKQKAPSAAVSPNKKFRGDIETVSPPAPSPPVENEPKNHTSK